MTDLIWIPDPDPRENEPRMDATKCMTVDSYTLDGKHVRTVVTGPDGETVWEEGANPGKDVAPLNSLCVCGANLIFSHWPVWDRNTGNVVEMYALTCPTDGCAGNLAGEWGKAILALQKLTKAERQLLGLLWMEDYK